MSVTSLTKDPTTLTMQVIAELNAPVERAWQMWEDPRLLERWWGPPMFPATFTVHELTPGAMSRYYMTSPEQEKFHGWWRVIAVDAPRRLEVEDGFADADGNPSHEMPTTRMVVELTEVSAGRTEMTITSKFASLEAMEQVIAMGVEEGLTAALNQIDALL